MRTFLLVLPTLLLAWAAAPDGAAPKTVLVVHGGAGVMTEAEMKKEGVGRKDYEAALAKALRAGYAAMKKDGATSVDGVVAAVRSMEDAGLFNAGRGAAFTHDGRVECDAALMEGKMVGKGEGKKDPRKRAGAVTGVAHVKNPILAARAVMEMKDSRHSLLAGDGAEDVAFTPENRERYGIEKVSNVYFWTDRRLRQIRAAVAGERRPGGRLGTVGAVAVKDGLAAGTSTGGLTNKLPGRVGDTPVIGAGTYADDRACGVSCTGTGEVFMRHVVAHDVAARMLYKKLGVAEAAKEAVAELPDEDGGVGGLIALDREGRHAFAMSARSDGMYRGYVNDKGEVYVAIYAKEAERRVD